MAKVPRRILKEMTALKWLRLLVQTEAPPLLIMASALRGVAMVAKVKKDKPPKAPASRTGGAGEKKAGQEENWDEVSESSMESFPASDPPSWIGRRPAEPSKKSRDD